MKNRINILITGAEGQLGQSFIELKNKKFNVISFSKKKLDITKYNDCKNKINQHNPKYIINCAAYTDVKKAEVFKKKAKLINSTGPFHLAKLCFQYNIILIHISTDFVFDGKKNKPYLETDKCIPLSIYGKTKLEGEKNITNTMKKFYIIRVSWLYGLGSNNFVSKVLSNGFKNKSIKIVDNEFGIPTFTYDLVNCIYKIINKTENKKTVIFGIYNFSGFGQRISRYQFAKKIFDISKIYGYKVPHIEKIYNKTDIRPKYSKLNINKIIENFSIKKINWKISLKTMLKIYFKNQL